MQFSLFGAEVAEPTLGDLDGLLLAGGDWIRTEGGGAARLSVLVTSDWRADALRAELSLRGLASDTAPAPGDLIAVRTEFTDRLVTEAQRWTRGASLRIPADLALRPSGLRLWAIATGRAEESGYLLGTADPDSDVHLRAGAQLAVLGVVSVSVAVRSRPGWRVTSAKRLYRLAEMIGQPPPGAGPDWPAR